METTETANEQPAHCKACGMPADKIGMNNFDMFDRHGKLIIPAVVKFMVRCCNFETCKGRTETKWCASESEAIKEWNSGNAVRHDRK